MLRKSDIQFRCPCQTWFAWSDPYFQFDLYCPSCGTVFRITRMREPFGYCVLPEGPCDVFGADSPRIDHLSESLRNTLYQIWEEFREFARTLPKSNVAPVLLVGDIGHFKMKLPPRHSQELTTFISNKAVQDGEGIPIMCNCSFMSLWIPKRGSGIDHMTCWACGSSIRLLGLEGDGGTSLDRQMERQRSLMSKRARHCHLVGCQKPNVTKSFSNLTRRTSPRTPSSE